MSFMIGSQFSCLATPNTQFQVAMDKHVLYQKANYYKGKELMTKDDEDAPLTRYIKARPDILFKHEPKVMQQKNELSRFYMYDMQRFYRLNTHCSGMELDEKPLVDGVHHEVGRFYETLNHSPFTIETPFKWSSCGRGSLVLCNFSFIVCLPHSRFILTHHVQPIIEKVDSDVEDATYQLVLAIGVYEPPPSKDYVRLIEAELQRMREALA